MNSHKAARIRAMVAVGRYADLYALVVGISPFCIDVPEGRPMNDVEQGNWQYACMHLEFRKNFGSDVDSAKDGKHFRFSYPEEFERWINSDSPGVSDDELLAYVSARPV